MEDTQQASGPALGTPSAGDHAPDALDAVRIAGVRAAHAAEHNWLLRSLSLEDYAWLCPQLTPVRLRFREVLIEPNEPIPYVWFIREGVASLIATEQDGGDVEVGTAGKRRTGRHPGVARR